MGRWLATTVWNDQAHGPGFRIALRKKGESQLLEKPLLQGQANFYMGNPFTWYYGLTGDPIFVERHKEMAQALGKPSIQDMALHYLATYGIGNWTYYLWFTEGGRIPGRKPLADF